MSTFQVPHSEPVKSPSISDLPEFHSLRRNQYRFGALATVVSVGGFLLYVLLSSFAPALMNAPLVGRFTVGLTLGLGQFVLMAVVVWRYVRYMGERVDPVAEELNAQQQHQQQQQEARRPGMAAQRRGPGNTTHQGMRGYRTW
ncbi:DUF485 domain-containing protein [Streptomyces sp. TRM68367]|nr:DUF485 domain-containing protein [Streptomyces sp. TRM68367]